MWPFSPSFAKKFGRIPGGWSCDQVWQSLGQPAAAEDTAIPLDSTWGLQAGLAYKIRPGDPVRQWMYESKGQFYYVWFARAGRNGDDAWRVTYRKVTAKRL